MNDVPEPDNFDPKEVYAFFGLAAYSAQVLEKGIVNMVVTFKTFGLKISRAEFDDIFYEHESRTLGQLLKMARDSHIPIPEETDKLLTQALNVRNYLNHDFFAAHSGDFVTEDGRRTMIRRLREMISLFTTADRSTELIYKPLLEQMGITDQVLKDAAQELIQRSAHGQDA